MKPEVTTQVAFAVAVASVRRVVGVISACAKGSWCIVSAGGSLCDISAGGSWCVVSAGGSLCDI